MESLLADAMERYAFVLLAVTGAVWLTARAVLFVRDVLLYLMELFVQENEESKRTHLGE